MGACPGDEESAGVNYSHRSPKGNRQMRRILNQTANAAARSKGSIFEIVFRRSVTRLGHNQAIGAIAHRQCRLIWLILHQGVRYEERGPAVTKQSKPVFGWGEDSVVRCDSRDFGVAESFLQCAFAVGRSGVEVGRGCTTESKSRHHVRIKLASMKKYRDDQG